MIKVSSIDDIINYIYDILKDYNPDTQALKVLQEAADKSTTMQKHLDLCNKCIEYVNNFEKPQLQVLLEELERVQNE